MIIACTVYPQSKRAAHPILFTTSSNGLNWNRDPVKLIDNGSSPSAIYNNDTIYLYYISDSLGLIISTDNARSFKHANVNVNRISGGILIDPNVVFTNGIFKMFFITSDAECNSLRYADSYDGFNFYEAKNVLYREKGIYKPDAVIHNKMCVLFITSGGDIIKLISNDGTIFTKDPLFFLPSAIYSCTVNENNYLRLYYTGDYSISSFKLIGEKATKEEINYIDHKIFISEPSVIKTTDSSYYMFYKKILPNDYIDTCGCERKLQVE